MKTAFWVRGTYIFQLTTALIHSMSFFADQQPANDTEKQLLELMNGYSMDMGAGFHRTMGDIFISLSACMTMLCFLSGLFLLVLWRRRIDAATLKQVLLVNSLVFAAGFAVMARFTFLPPILLFGLILLCSTLAYFSIKPQTANAS